MLVQKLKKTLKKPMFWVTILGVSLVPALYNLSFLTSMWDPYGNVKNLPVAVVNEDKAASYRGQNFTVGQNMVDNLKDNSSLDFHFVSEAEGKKGLERGDYYMVITLPSDLSQKATTLLTDHPEKMMIEYETSKGHSFVASKMGESAMTKIKEQVSETITETYTRTVFSSMRQLQGGLNQAVTGTQKLQTGTEQLQAGSASLTNGLSTFKNGLGTYTNGVAQASSGSQTLNEKSTSLAGGTSQLVGGAHQLSDGLGMLQDKTLPLTNGLSQLAQGTGQLDAQSSNLLAGLDQFQAGLPRVKELATGLSNLRVGLETLSQKTQLSDQQSQQLATLTASLPQLQEGIQQLNRRVSQLDVSGLANFDFSQVEGQLATMRSQLESLKAQIASDQAASLAAVRATAAYQSMTSEQQSEIEHALTSSPSSADSQLQNTLSNLETLGTILSQARTSLGALQGQVNALQQLKTSLGTMQTSADQLLPGALQALTNLRDGFAQVHQGIDQQLLPGASQASSGADLLYSSFSSGASRLSSGFQQYASGVSRVNDGLQMIHSQTGNLTSGVATLSAGAETLQSGLGRLSTGLGQYTNGVAQLDRGLQRLAQSSSSLSSGLTRLSDGSQTITTNLATVSQAQGQLHDSLQAGSNQLSTVTLQEKNADTVASPVATSHVDQDRVATNGVGMAPYMMAVSLMVVALSANVVFAKSIDEEEYTDRWEWAKSKLVLNGGIATLAAILLYGTVRLVGVDFAHPGATFGLTLLSSWVFMALVTALIGWNQRFGSFASLLLLVLQLGASAGTYPIELSPRFFGWIQPFLPMTYVVSGLRQTISMRGDIHLQLSVLSFFLFLFTALAVLIFQPGQTEVEG
ncbi:YhgE/Pip domain-containing protein [Streptococcus sp. DD13]|uniref:YhgE/Pip domain-containing protein n=1 Tax=Streptococcus sp. DD13 TaxID=1777881 RepID=UPI0007935130|nr:YhgE/Pip domain-containing protein [Streptococcus sp. DD13]KXT77959.1 Phage infection protein [Streptococcus sp. DD13]